MPKRIPRTTTRLPIKYPSIPDVESGPTTYNEPALAVATDRMPVSGFQYGTSRADLRLQIERLLLRRCPLPEGSAIILGEAARGLLVEMLDDEAIRSQETLFHRLIALIGELKVRRAVGPLSELLRDRGLSNLTKAYTANALGRIGESAALGALVAASNIRDVMARRQIAIALGRINVDAVIPHLLLLQSDKSIAVAEVAAEGLKGWESRLGKRLGTGSKQTKAKNTRRKIVPPEDRR